MDFIKKNKFTVIAVSVFLILLLLLIQIKNIFFPNEGKASYGNRLDGIEKVKISNAKKSEIEKSLISDGIAKKATIRISGKIIEVKMIVNAEVSVDSAKALSGKLLEKLSNEEKKFYDIQVFIDKDEESEEFPIIGYNHHAKKDFSWTKNR